MSPTNNMFINQQCTSRSLKYRAIMYSKFSSSNWRMKLQRGICLPTMNTFLGTEPKGIVSGINCLAFILIVLLEAFGHSEHTRTFPQYECRAAHLAGTHCQMASSLLRTSMWEGWWTLINGMHYGTISCGIPTASCKRESADGTSTQTSEGTPSHTFGRRKTSPYCESSDV